MTDIPETPESTLGKELKKQVHNFLCEHPLFEKVLERVSDAERYVKQQTHALEFALAPFISKEQHESLRKEFLQALVSQQEKIKELEERLSKVEKP